MCFISTIIFLDLLSPTLYRILFFDSNTFFQNELFFLILSSQLLPYRFVNKYLNSNFSIFVLYLKVEFRYQRVVAFRMKQRKENEL